MLVPQVPVEVNPELLQQLTEMGFGETRAQRGLHFSGNSTLEVGACGQLCFEAGYRSGVLHLQQCPGASAQSWQLALLDACAAVCGRLTMCCPRSGWAPMTVSISCSPAVASCCPGCHQLVGGA
jgi:hypothetical protein